MSTKLTCINLKRTKTLSNIPSNSSSDVPLLPARSFSSRNFAISSAGRFCQHEPNIMFYSVTEKKNKKSKGTLKMCFKGIWNIWLGATKQYNQPPILWFAPWSIWFAWSTTLFIKFVGATNSCCNKFRF